MILRPWTGQNKPPLGVQPNRAHSLRPDYAWLLNERNGRAVYDVVAGKIATLSGGATWHPDGIDFDGASGGISLPLPFAANSCTLIARVRADAAQARFIVTQIYNPPDALWWWFGTDTDPDNLQAFWNGSAYVYSNTPIPVGEWRNIAVVNDVSANKISFYMDGVADGGGASSRTSAYAGLGWLGRNNAGTFYSDGQLGHFMWFQGANHTMARELTAIPYQWLAQPDLAGMWAGIPGVGAPGYYYRYLTRMWGEA